MFSFAYPWLFVLLILPIMIRLVLPKTNSENVALNISFIDELSNITQSGKVNAHNKRARIIYFVIWILLVTAAARPQWIGDAVPIDPKARDMMIAIDTSGSMGMDDMSVGNVRADRLAVIKNLFSPFVANRVGDRVGLIMFGSFAVQLAPLTYDRLTIKKWIDDAYIGQAGTETAIGDAIALSTKVLMKEKESSRILILITDGSNNSGTIGVKEAVELAKQGKVKIYTIGIGSDKMIYAGFSAVPASYDLDEDTLKMIASETGGDYFRARDMNDLAAITEEINHLEPIDHESLEFHFKTEFYPYPLGLAMFICFITALSYAIKNRRVD